MFRLMLCLLLGGCAVEPQPLDGSPVSAIPEDVYVPPDIDYGPPNLPCFEPGVCFLEGIPTRTPIAFDSTCVAPDGSQYPCPTPLE